MTQGIFQLTLTPESTAEVRSLFPAKFANVPEKLHVTLLYGAVFEDHSELKKLVGDRFKISVHRHCFSSRVQALEILRLGFRGQNLKPHITLSWVDGSSPVESNAMLRGVRTVHSFFEVELDTVLEFVPWN